MSEDYQSEEAESLQMTDIFTIIDQRIAQLESYLEVKPGHESSTAQGMLCSTEASFKGKEAFDDHSRSRPSTDQNRLSKLLTPSSQLKSDIHAKLKCTTLSPADGANPFGIEFIAQNQIIGEELLRRLLQEKLPTETNSLRNITVLSLRQNNLFIEDLQSFSFLSWACPFVQSIDLSGNRLSGNFPVSWATSALHKNIVSLDLSSNELQDIKNIVVFENLEYFYASHNRISCLVAFPSKSLKHLNLSFNNIDSMINFRMIGMCKELRSLSINGNPLCPHDDSKESKNLSNSIRIAAYSLFPKLEQLNDKPLSRCILQQIEKARQSSKTAIQLQDRIKGGIDVSRISGKKERVRVDPKLNMSRTQRNSDVSLSTNSTNTMSTARRKDARSPSSKKYTSKVITKNSVIMLPSRLYKEPTKTRAASREPLVHAVENKSKPEKVKTLVDTELKSIEQYIERLKKAMQVGADSVVIACNIACFEVHLAIDGKLLDERMELISKFKESLSQALMHPALDLPDSIRCALLSKDTGQSRELQTSLGDVSALAIILQGLQIVLCETIATKPATTTVKLKPYIEMLMQTEAGKIVNERILIPRKILFEKIMEERFETIKDYIGKDSIIEERLSSTESIAEDNQKNPRNNFQLNIATPIEPSKEKAHGKLHVNTDIGKIANCREIDPNSDSPSKRHKTMEILFATEVVTSGND